MIVVNVESYKRICEEDLRWLLSVPHSLERQHIVEILKWHIENPQAAIDAFREIEEKRSLRTDGSEWFRLTPFKDHKLRRGVDKCSSKNIIWNDVEGLSDCSISEAESMGFTEFRCLLKDVPEHLRKVKEEKPVEQSVQCSGLLIFRCNICGGLVQFDGTKPSAGHGVKQ